MARGFREALRNSLLDQILGSPGSLGPATAYVALSTTTPTTGGGNFTEPGAGAYARVAVTNNGTQWPAAAAGVKSNANIILFPSATADWGIVTHFGIYDAAAAGNLIAWGALDISRDVKNGDQFRFQANQCKLEFVNV